MAQKTQVILVDDVDGSEANQTVTFALGATTGAGPPVPDHGGAGQLGRNVTCRT